MTHSEALSEIKAFAEVNGFEVLMGMKRDLGKYTIAKDYNGKIAPRCPYMEPKELAIWIDGYRMGLNAASAPIQAEV